MKAWRLLRIVAGTWALWSAAGSSEACASPAAVAIQVRGPLVGSCDLQAIHAKIQRAKGPIRRCVGDSAGSWTAKVALAPGKAPETKQMDSNFAGPQRRCLQARALRVLASAGPASCVVRLQVTVTQR